jgi:hypothetical protein
VLDAANRLDPVADALATTRHATNWRHTFGRFRVASWGTTDVALLIRHVDTPVYALRISVPELRISDSRNCCSYSLDHAVGDDRLSRELVRMLLSGSA